MTTRRLIVPLTLALMVACAARVEAQGAFPAPQSVAPPDDCMKDFARLRGEAETRGKLIKAASDRHAPAAEACGLIGDFSRAEVAMIKYVEINAVRCGIPPQIADQLEANHQSTETMQLKVCAVGQHGQQNEPSGPTGDFWILPEKSLDHP